MSRASVDALIERSRAAVRGVRALYEAADLPVEVVLGRIKPEGFQRKLRSWMFLTAIVLGLLAANLFEVRAQRVSEDEYRRHLEDTIRGYRELERIQEQQRANTKDIDRLVSRMDITEARLNTLEKMAASQIESVKHLTYAATGISGLTGLVFVAVIFKAAKLKT